MNRIITRASTLSLSAAVALQLALPAFAETNLDPCTGPGSTSKFRSQLCGINANQTGTFITNLVIAAFVIAGLIALFFLIWGGIKWILSGGDKAKVEAARSTIIAAIIGLIVTFLAYFILSLTLSLFGLGLSDLKIPTLTVTK